MVQQIIHKIVSLMGTCLLFTTAVGASLPQDFVYLKAIDSTIYQEMRYAGNNNFIGKALPGYDAAECILTLPAALALKDVQQELLKQGYALKVFDCYRPQRAVNYFIQWSQDEQAQAMKQQYYPYTDKTMLFTLGYIAKRSGHTRGSTVDLTIVQKADASKALDMWTDFDYFGEVSYTDHFLVPEQVRKNRDLLRQVMQAHGFENYTKEWWHYTLQNEPYPEQYFDFAIRVDNQ
jgi:D-alanyl-D-alanine dipeptidase